MRTDHPLDTLHEDTLGRTRFAENIAESLLQFTSSKSVVVGVQGPWGSGKSTILSFLAELVQKDEHFNKLNVPEKTLRPVIVKFNPWWFSGQEDLFARFFQELGAQVGGGRANLDKVAEIFKKLSQGSRLLSKVGILPEFLSDGSGFVAEMLKGDVSLDALRESVKIFLEDSQHPVWVLIDDVERLQPHEVRQMFALIRSVGDLPYMRYVLAFDPYALEQIVDAPSTPGERYVEKIVQVPFTVPEPDTLHLIDTFHVGVNQVLVELAGSEHIPVFSREQANRCYDYLRPYLKSIRPVNRLVNSLRMSLPPVFRNVHITDFVLLEALKVFKPAVYRQLPLLKDRIVASRKFYDWVNLNRSPGARENHAQTLNWLLTGLDEQERIQIERILKFLFPALTYTMYSDSPYHKEDPDLRVSLINSFYTYFELSEQVKVIDDEAAESLIKSAKQEPDDLVELLQYHFSETRVVYFQKAIEILAANLPNETTLDMDQLGFALLKYADGWTGSFRYKSIRQPLLELLIICLIRSKRTLNGESLKPIIERVITRSPYLAFKASFEIMKTQRSDTPHLCRAIYDATRDQFIALVLAHEPKDQRGSFRSTLCLGEV